ncbi:hypothetical protein [Chondrinema litorale]|uniref:hypothetical protein n=1 Tax=Chondrinema litorale TaxID=2994555 RepID=UPI00254333FD|nr:hypothetical protein [Chondrinema litorale]UZR95555.1 hypothetical protein OQ292_06975 [Chondrinema litorale]
MNKVYDRLFKALLLIFLLVSQNKLFAQNADMSKDLKVMEEILTELINRESESNSRSRSAKASASYIENYGIIMRLPVLRSNTYIGVGDVAIATDLGQSQRIVFNSNSNTVVTGSGSVTSTVQIDSATNKYQSEKVEKIQKIMKMFLVNYGDLARDLPENEKIILYYAEDAKKESYVLWNGVNSSSSYFTGNVKAEKLRQISAEVLKSDLIKFKQKNLSEEAFWSMVKVKVIKGESKDDEMLEYGILAKIFESLLSSTNENTFYPGDDDLAVLSFHEENNVKFQVLSGLGVVYHISLGYPVVLDDGQSRKFYRNTRNRNNDEEEDEDEIEEDWKDERDAKVSEIYPDFIDELKKNIVEYGRTLRKLEKGELLIVEADMPFCFECEMPATIKLSIEQSVLDAYDSRKIDLDDAIDKINVKEEGKASERSHRNNFLFNWRE